MKQPTSRLSLVVFVCTLYLFVPTFAQDANQPAIVPQTSQAAMEEIAARLAQKAKKIGCDSSQCSLLVADFYTSSKSTSPLGLQLSEEFVVLLAKALPNATIMNRSPLRQFLNRNRIPAEILKEENAERWLGRRLGATAILVGEFKFKPGNAEGKFKLLDVGLKIRNSQSFSTKLPELLFKEEDLQASEAYPKLEKTFKNEQGDVIPWGGKDGVIAPRCSYMPNPSYTDEAREAKLSGDLILDAIITEQGEVEFQRVARGLPFNLNDQAIWTMGTWRCTPATKDGRPISSLVAFEVSFRLY